MQTFKRKKIGIILMERGKLNPDQLPVIIEKLATTSRRFGEIAVHEGFVTEEDLAQALAEQFRLEYIDLRNFKMDSELLNQLPPDAIYRFHLAQYQRALGPGFLYSRWFHHAAPESIS